MSRFAPLFDRYSIEATARDAANPAALPQGLHRPAHVFVPYLAEEDDAARLAACAALVTAGHDPVLHLSARRVPSPAALDRLLGALAQEAGVRRLFLIAGDLAQPAGPFADSMAIIRSGLIEHHGFVHAGIAGHPDGHPDVAAPVLWQAMADKAAMLADRGLDSEIVTQFSFDAARVLRWLAELRARGVELPVRIGIPGPAGVRTLLRFATRCGVAASAGVVAKYGLSLGRLIGNAGPERFLDDLARGLALADHGRVQLHVFPFGGFDRLSAWMAEHATVPA